VRKFFLFQQFLLNTRHVLIICFVRVLWCFIARSPNGTPSVYTVAATVVLGLSTLAAALQWSYGDWRQSDSIAESWRIVDQFSTILGGSMTAPAALGIVVSVVAVLVGCAWIIARRIRSARVAKTRLASCRAWTSEAWNQVGSRHHISALAGGQLSTLVLGADTVERAEKWRRVFEKVRLSRKKIGVFFLGNN